MRPALVALLLGADALVVAELAIGRPRGWLSPFIAFGAVLVGLVWLEIWALRHRRDADRGGQAFLLSRVLAIIEDVRRLQEV